MKHAMKMVLVPHESVARLQEKPTVPTPQSQMNSLDSEMKLIMRKRYVDENGNSIARLYRDICILPVKTGNP